MEGERGATLANGLMSEWDRHSWFIADDVDTDEPRKSSFGLKVTETPGGVTHSCCLLSKLSWRAFGGWHEAQACISWLEVAPSRVYLEIESSRSGLHLDVDTRCVFSTHRWANLTLRLLRIFITGSSSFLMFASNWPLFVRKTCKIVAFKVEGIT